MKNKETLDFTGYLMQLVINKGCTIESLAENIGLTVEHLLSVLYGDAKLTVNILNRLITCLSPDDAEERELVRLSKNKIQYVNIIVNTQGLSDKKYDLLRVLSEQINVLPDQSINEIIDIMKGGNAAEACINELNRRLNNDNTL